MRVKVSSFLDGEELFFGLCLDIKKKRSRLSEDQKMVFFTSRKVKNLAISSHSVTWKIVLPPIDKF